MGVHNLGELCSRLQDTIRLHGYDLSSPIILSLPFPGVVKLFNSLVSYLSGHLVSIQLNATVYLPVEPIIEHQYL